MTCDLLSYWLLEHKQSIQALRGSMKIPPLLLSDKQITLHTGTHWTRSLNDTTCESKYSRRSPSITCLVHAHTQVYSRTYLNVHIKDTNFVSLFSDVIFSAKTKLKFCKIHSIFFKIYYQYFVQGSWMSPELERRQHCH